MTRRRRLDDELVEQGFFSNREDAMRAVMAGEVSTQDRRLERAGEQGDLLVWRCAAAGETAAGMELESLIEGAGLERLAQDGGAAMLCGTFAAIGGVRPAARIRMAMHNPVRDRSITLTYQAEALEVVA